jgi:hypothetical protein
VIYRFAQRHRAAVLSGDLGFSNTLRLPLGSHRGIVIARFPNDLSSDRINAEVKKSLAGLTDDDFRGNLIVLSPGRVRVRRHK